MKILVFVLMMVPPTAFGAAPSAKKAELPVEAKLVLAETQGAGAVVAVTEADIAAAEAQAAEGPSARGPAAESRAADEKAEAVLTAELKKTAAEDQIPLHLDGKKATAEGGGAWARIMAGFAVLAVLLAGAWYGLRKAGRPGQRKNAPQIKVLNQHYLGPKKSLAIIRVAGESILIGVTDQNISLIKALSLMDDEMPEETPNRFTQAMDQVGLKDKAIEEADSEGEDFQMTGLNQIKDAVSRRLKGMRSLE